MENKKVDRSEGQSQPGEGSGERLQPDEVGPAKRHGDALQDGSGTRHGVTEPDERPES